MKRIEVFTKFSYLYVVVEKVLCLWKTQENYEHELTNLVLDCILMRMCVGNGARKGTLRYQIKRLVIRDSLGCVILFSFLRPTIIELTTSKASKRVK